MTDPSPPPNFATTAQHLAARYADWAAANEFQYAYTRTTPHPAATSQRGSPDVRLVLHRVHLFDGAHRGLAVSMSQLNEIDSFDTALVNALSHELTLRLPGPRPTLQIGHEGPLSPLWRVLGMGDKTYGHDGFDRKFRVSTDDTRFARDFLTPATMAWLLEHPIADVGTFHVKDRALRLSIPGPLGPVSGLPPKLEFLYELHHRMPVA
ncbi:hypothetical protein [Stackebrandtia nassauensis]|uniref:Uncharacterized protein n=1 Tax=Stackebrandtia nassauensis (strain DSM 44728 / CIP 108903 / NRRL B-16338 / NBRC 102104 / LLR-40K-21) TaxID=446470 RepID=D3Q927_STANL|nr:hypothetical protein [Stackebrandtia nassauensis]ADD40636.1 hypothetical protein Snas_0925 [Stackebrandtia nassauensis DSM 44728]